MSESHPAEPVTRAPAEGAAREALDLRFSLAYEELRRLAQRVRRDEPAASITPTALVNEAWLKLAATPAVAATGALHFRRIAARAMRQVLVEAARRRRAEKRGGGHAAITLDEALGVADVRLDVLDLDDALERLAAVAPRQAQVVEGRFFAGLEVAELADVLGVSEVTVARDWRAARAWLTLALRDPAVP